MSILLQLGLTFFKIGLFAYGGGYAAIALIVSEIVQMRQWITEHELLQVITVSEMTPGAIAVKGAAFVGYHVAGLPGAVAATAGVILPSLLLAGLAFHFYSRLSHMGQVQSIMTMLRPAVLAVIILAVAKLAGPALPSSTAAVIFAAALLAALRFRLHPLTIILGAGIAGLVIFTLQAG